MGERNLSRSSNRSRRSTRKASHSERGKVFLQNGGVNRARAIFQKALCTKWCCHHSRQCSSVRRSIFRPRASRKSCTRLAVIPCRMAETRTTTNPTYTLRPRKRTDGGVRRLRQSAQQKLSRSFQVSGPPRGFLSKLPRCNLPPQFRQPPCRYFSAKSESHFSNKANKIWSAR